jgi:hypothetical protein
MMPRNIYVQGRVGRLSAFVVLAEKIVADEGLL